MSIGQLYAVPPQIIPSNVQYAALGHVHKPQEFPLANAYYCGSLLQLDFGEAGQQKRVNIVDVSPGRPAKIEHVPLTSIKQLRNIGSHKEGLTLEQIKALADGAGEDYLKVFLKADAPAPGLAEQVRELLPNAVDIVVQRPEREGEEQRDQLGRQTPGEMFTDYYQQTHSANPPEDLMALFNELYGEVAHETA